MISIKLHSNFIQIILQHGCSPVNLFHIFRTCFFHRNTFGGPLQNCQKNAKQLNATFTTSEFCIISTSKKGKILCKGPGNLFYQLSNLYNVFQIVTKTVVETF